MPHKVVRPAPLVSTATLPDDKPEPMTSILSTGTYFGCIDRTKASRRTTTRNFLKIRSMVMWDPFI